MLLDRETTVRTLCVTLLLCTVCGLNLHAAENRALSDSLISGVWQSIDPGEVFAADEDCVSPGTLRWETVGPPGKTIANCRLNIANCKMDATEVASLRPTQRNLQFAIPFDRDAASNLRGSGDDWIRLVSDDEPDEIDEPELDGDSALSMGFQQDIRGFLPGVWRDARGVVRTENMLILGTALAAAIGIRQDLDDEVRHDTAANPDRWGEASTILGKLGEAPYQVPVLGIVWISSLLHRDSEQNDFAHALISAYTINGLSVLVIKGITDTDRPDPDWNGGRWGFPSFHAASSFSIAGVLEEYYGWKAGLPAYTLAGLISWSRVDERDHDLSDVVFGAAMGWVIGKSVAGTHLRNDGRVMLMPWSHPYERAQGVALEVRY